MKLNLALISPNQGLYSETFIQNHRFMDANIKYYYGDHLPTHLEGEGKLNPPFINHFKFHIKEIIGKPSPPNLLLGRAIVRSFKENKIHAVFAEYGPTGVAIAPYCEELQIPLIVNFHGYDASTYSVLNKYKEAYKLLFRQASKIIVVSQVMKQKILELGCPDDKIAYIVYGPKDEFLQLEPQYTEKAFLAVGRFVDKKAPYYTIMAMKKVIERYPEAKLYMAGDGPLLNACSNLINYMGMNQNIQLLGVQNHEQLQSYYTKVIGFVQHSIRAMNGDMEGTPVAVLEASAMALPVVSTFHAGIPDIIIDEKTGLLVEEHDVDGMANKMLYLLDNRNKAIKMGQDGREYIKQNYSMRQHLESLNSIIHQL